MQCPSCGAGIPDDALRCEFCGRPVNRGAASPRGVAARPSKFHVEDDGALLRISWRWFSPVVFFLLPFAIAWNAFLVGWYGMATGDMGPSPFFFRLIFLVFPLGHVAVGVGLAYFVLALIFNRSEVLVDRGVLSVKHGPIPWSGATVNSDDIEQIFCKQTGRGGSDAQPSFSVQARLKDGSVRSLLSHVTSSEEALYLEQAIERHLRIRDVPVSGELPRDA
jgi:hypothetical protein